MNVDWKWLLIGVAIGVVVIPRVTAIVAMKKA